MFAASHVAESGAAGQLQFPRVDNFSLSLSAAIVDLVQQEDLNDAYSELPSERKAPIRTERLLISLLHPQ